MKTRTLIYPLLISIMLLVFGPLQKLCSQNIIIDSTFTVGTEIFPFTAGNNIYGLSVSGHVTLNSDTSLVRLVLYDSLFNEFLLYESYPMIASSSTFSFSNKCDETCFLDETQPYSVEIQLINASIEIFTLNPINDSVQGPSGFQQAAKQTLELLKAIKINNYIEENNMAWVADTNSISQLSYENKKSLLGGNYNLLGYDFYRGGLYSATQLDCIKFTDKNMIEDWDWRNRHGANDSEKEDYFDGDDVEYSGWMTSVKNQEVNSCDGLCYIYAPLGALEGLANIYFCEHRDYHLSVQNVLDCGITNNENPCKNGDPSQTMRFIRDYGVVDDACYQRESQQNECDTGPIYPDGEAEYRISTEDHYHSQHSDIDIIREMILIKGPMNATIRNYGAVGSHHAMAIIGFGIADEGDMICSMPNIIGLNCFTIPDDYAYIGCPYWIFKGSESSNWGMNGYVYHIAAEVNTKVKYFTVPIDDLLTEGYDNRLCPDNDNDGYFNWMVGDMPLTCPPDAEKDSDDSESRIGPFDDNYYGIPVAPIMNVKDNSTNVPHKSFYTFFDSGLTVNQQMTLSFTIQNEGDAQLNLLSANTFTWLDDNQECFVVELPDNYTNVIAKGEQTTFDVIFTLLEPIGETKIETLTIHNLEPDIEDYEITFVFADCVTSPDPEEITGTVTWPETWPENNTTVKFSDVYVKSGAILTIRGDVGFAPDARFFNDYNVFPYEQLFLEEVGEIIIYGCSFINMNPSKGSSYPFLKKSYGIKSENSNFVVDKYTDNQGEIVQSRFIKHNYGIHATSSGRYCSEIIRIDSSCFDDNETGIYMGAIEKPQITRNEFLVKDKYTKFSGNESIGLYLDTYTTAFMVEGNNFYSTLRLSSIETEKCNGITTNNTGEDYNEIYNNRFDKLTFGITAAGTNRDEDGLGLCFRCNDFINIITDVYITITDDNPVGEKQGIAKDQGQLAPQPEENQPFDRTLSAGNTFSKFTEDFTKVNYYNKDPNNNEDYCESIIYTYHGVDPSDYYVTPDPTYPAQPTNHLILRPDPNVEYDSKDLACPSNLSGGGIDMMAMTSQLETSSESAVAYTDTLNMFVDGGNTTALNLDVSTSIPDESLVLRQQLLNESPYLSDTVMKSAVDKENVLPNAMLRDVLVANPQSAKSADVMQSINQRETAMPDYMMEEIEEGTGINGGKDILVNKLAKNKKKRDVALNSLLLHYMSDTANISASRDSIIYLLQNRQYPGPRYQLAMLYLSEGDSINTFNTLDNIEYELELTDGEDFAHDLFVNLTEIQWQLKNDTTIADSIQIVALFDIAENSNTHASIYARNMLVAMGEMEYQEPHYFPLILKAKPIFGYNRDKGKQQASYLKVFPNPANDYFTNETKIDRDFSEAQLVLVNLEGKKIKQIELLKKRNQIIVTTEGIVSGTYLVKLIVSGKMIDSKKVVIVK